MLLETKTDAHIIAFEPHPKNLYNIKLSIMIMEKEYRDRITLFPTGLGKTSSTIRTRVGNLGNSIIDTKEVNFTSEQWDEVLPYAVNIER